MKSIASSTHQGGRVAAHTAGVDRPHRRFGAAAAHPPAPPLRGAGTKLAAQGSSHGYGGKHKVSRRIVEASVVDLGGAPNDGQGIGSDPRFNTRGTAGIGGPMDVEALCDQFDQRRADLR